jgi:hypothetical protein
MVLATAKIAEAATVPARIVRTFIVVPFKFDCLGPGAR